MKLEYKSPKVLEKKPVIAGFDLTTIVVLTVCVLLFVFTIFSSLLVAALALIIGAGYIKIQNKYPRKGQLKIILKHTSSIQCVRIDQPLSTLIKSN